MFYLILAILSSACVSLIMRASENHIHHQLGMLSVNYVICSIMGLLFTGGLSFNQGHSFALGLGVIAGCFYLISFMMLQYSISVNGVVLSALFSKLGILVPIAVSMIIFHEAPTVIQIIGFIFALGSIVYMNGEKDESSKFNYLLIVLMLIMGSCDTFAKIYEELGTPSYNNQFLFYTFLFACILCFTFMFYKKQSIRKEELLFGCLIGIPNYFSAKFLLMALRDIPAVITYPTYSIATIVCITIVGVIAFKERLTAKRIISMIGIMIALVLLNI